jgi:hypothetical protein
MSQHVRSCGGTTKKTPTKKPARPKKKSTAPKKKSVTPKKKSVTPKKKKATIPPPLHLLPYTYTVPVGPAYFNGCMPKPVVPVVTTLSSPESGVYMRPAPGEPNGVVGIAPPTQQQTVLGSRTTMPTLVPGEEIPPSGDPGPSVDLWTNITQYYDAEGQLLTGPMWAVWSQKEQTYLVTYQTPKYVDGHWTYATNPPVPDGAPAWHAGEAYDVNSCPAIIVTFSPNGS